MSQPGSQQPRRNTTSLGGLARVSALRSSGGSTDAPSALRRPSIGNLGRSLSGSAPAAKPSKVQAPPKTVQRTTKTSQKLVVLPSEVQTAPLPEEEEEDEVAKGPPTATSRFKPSGGEFRSEGEKMNKTERQRAGYRRMTAYLVGEGFRLKLLLAYLKREHGVSPRVFDEAVYAASLYHLPLLPGYGPNVKLRSSAAPRSPEGGSILSHLSEAEDLDYDGGYFATGTSPERFSLMDGYISGSPPNTRHMRAERTEATAVESEAEQESPTIPTLRIPPKSPRKPKRSSRKEEDRIAEIVVFDYGVVVFFGFEESQERDLLEDFDRSMICVRPRPEDRWEVEMCHFVYDPTVASPRIYNDFFTFKAHSHLLKVSISHALAQSVVLGHYETVCQNVLSGGQTMAIPKQLAATGELKLGRSAALRLTGRLFKLRKDVNLVSNVLDTPELFWSEASLKDLYQACREYFEIDSRVDVLNQKLSVTSELLDIIHDHLNNGAMERITWIIIWLIVVACLVELGEVLARLVVGAAKHGSSPHVPPGPSPSTSPEELLRIVNNIMSS